MTTRSIAIAFALVAAQGCNKDPSQGAQGAAERVVDRQVQLQDQREELADKQVSDVRKANQLVKTSGELAAATREFEERRAVRMATLRGVHEVIATQPMVISTIAQALPLTEAGRADIDEKLQVFQMRLDEAENLIRALAHARADEYGNDDNAVTGAMKRLEESRKAAWQALDNAPRSDRSS